MEPRLRPAFARMLAVAGLVLMLSASPSHAQVPLESPSQAAAAKRWLVILCGLPGDQLHRERLTAAVEKIAAAAEPVLLVPEERVRVLVGDTKMAEEVGDTVSDADICTAAAVRKLFQSLGEQLSADDACWVICLGHAQQLATRTTFNVQGADFDGGDFARSVSTLKCRQRVFILTTPLSGFWIKPLTGPETISIAATEPGPELTATEMPYALADILAGTQAHQRLSDIDEDGRLSLLDLYLAVSLEVQQRYKAIDRLQTEHAQLDDNGDGIGKELQEPYLPPEVAEGAEAPASNPPPRRAKTLNGDGNLASRVEIGAPTPIEKPSAEEPAAAASNQVGAE